MNKLIVNNLTKHFPKKGKITNSVLSGACAEWEEGRVGAIVGRNGAGKSTLFRIIGGLTKANSGEVVIPPTLGLLGLKKKSKVALLSPNSGLHEQLTIQENILSFSRICSNHDNELDLESLISKFGLSQHKDHKPHEVSTGIIQRTRIAQILSLNPKVILLDEPTSGLDIQGKAEFYSLINELKSKNKIILISTHDINEITEVCQTISIVANGKIEQGIELEGERVKQIGAEKIYKLITDHSSETSNV